MCCNGVVSLLTALQKKRLRRALPYLSLAGAVLFLFASILGIVLIQKPLREETQDARSQASIADGTVFIRSPQNGQVAAFAKDTERTLQLEIKTQGEPIKKIHLVFNIITTVFDPPLLKLPTTTKFAITSQELEKTKDGFLVSSIIEPTNSENFTSGDWQPLAELVFTPVRGGNIKLAFDAETSTALSATTNQDVLKHIDSISYSIIGGPESPAVPEAVGGVVPDLCNVLCSSNAQCGPNQRCFNTGTEQRCRLVTNVSSTSCSSAPTTTGTRSCNENCSDSRECATGLSCWYNLCRNSLAVEDASCTAPSQAQQQALAQRCNTDCTSNADCPNNMRCFAQKCRLATNPSSTSCSSADSLKVSSLYPTKGGLTASTPTQTTPPSTAAPTPPPSPSIVPSPSPSALPVPSLDPVLLEPLDENRTALDDFLSIVRSYDPRAFFNRFNASLTPDQYQTATQLLPFIALGLGLVLLVVVAFFFLRSTLMSRSSRNDQPPNSPAVTAESKPATPAKNQEKRLPDLPSSPVPRDSRSLGVQPVSAPLASFLKQQVKKQDQPQPNTTAQEDKPASASPMLDRLKKKGVTPPR